MSDKSDKEELAGLKSTIGHIDKLLGKAWEKINQTSDEIHANKEKYMPAVGQAKVAYNATIKINKALSMIVYQVKELKKELVGHMEKEEKELEIQATARAEYAKERRNNRIAIFAMFLTILGSIFTYMMTTGDHFSAIEANQREFKTKIGHIEKDISDNKADIRILGKKELTDDNIVAKIKR